MIPEPRWNGAPGEVNHHTQRLTVVKVILDMGKTRKASDSHLDGHVYPVTTLRLRHTAKFFMTPALSVCEPKSECQKPGPASSCR